LGRVPPWAVAIAALGYAGCASNPQDVQGFAGTGACSACHTGPGDPAPFHDTTGSTDPTKLSVGAHDGHLHAGLSSNVTCADCHVQPTNVNQPGHLDATPPSDVVFGTLARTGGADPHYVANGCAATYCHGTFPGGSGATPLWLGGAAAGACGTCHGLPPATGQHPIHNSLGIGCETCHGPLTREAHVNGVVNVPLPAWTPSAHGCATACHVPRLWFAGG
jgi:predicted CxxxxCH...CXXCH cytochrome family protein